MHTRQYVGADASAGVISGGVCVRACSYAYLTLTCLCPLLFPKVDWGLRPPEPPRSVGPEASLFNIVFGIY